MNKLNTKQQGKSLYMTCTVWRTLLWGKLQSLSSQLENKILTHMKNAQPPADNLHRYSSMLAALHADFEMLWKLWTIDNKMHMISSPFTCSVENTSSDIQLVFNDLPSDIKSDFSAFVEDQQKFSLPEQIQKSKALDRVKEMTHCVHLIQFWSLKSCKKHAYFVDSCFWGKIMPLCRYFYNVGFTRSHPGWHTLANSSMLVFKIQQNVIQVKNFLKWFIK